MLLVSEAASALISGNEAPKTQTWCSQPDLVMARGVSCSCHFSCTHVLRNRKHDSVHILS